MPNAAPMSSSVIASFLITHHLIYYPSSSPSSSWSSSPLCPSGSSHEVIRFSFTRRLYSKSFNGIVLRVCCLLVANVVDLRWRHSFTGCLVLLRRCPLTIDARLILCRGSFSVYQTMTFGPDDGLGGGRIIIVVDIDSGRREHGLPTRKTLGPDWMRAWRRRPRRLKIWRWRSWDLKTRGRRPLRCDRSNRMSIIAPREGVCSSLASTADAIRRRGLTDGTPPVQVV